MAVNEQPSEPGAETAQAVISRVEVPVLGGGVMVIETKSDQSVWVNGSKVEPAAQTTRSPVTWATATTATPTPEERQED